MVGFNRVREFVSGSTCLLGIGGLLITTLPIQAQTPPVCYLVTQSGQRVDLTTICGVQGTPATTADSNVTNPQANQNLPMTNFQQGVINPQNPVGQGTISTSGIVSGQGIIGTPGIYIRQGAFAVQNTGRIGSSGIVVPSGQFIPVTNSASLRTEPSSGSLIQQLSPGEAVRVYSGTRTGDAVYVETLNGQTGWINNWYLPGVSGSVPY